jgi:acid phosphatase
LSLLDDDFQKSPTKQDDHSLQVPTNNIDYHNSHSNGTIPNNLAASRSMFASPKRPGLDNSSGPPPMKVQKVSQTTAARRQPSLPVTNAPSSGLVTPANPLHHPFHPPPSSFNSSLPHPSESVDLLYEYFPLSMDDWQVPVDAVYRPHVVHHTNMPSDSRFMAARGKSSRYFAAEDVC